MLFQGMLSRSSSLASGGIYQLGKGCRISSLVGEKEVDFGPEINIVASRNRYYYSGNQKFLGIKLFRFSRYKAEIFSIYMILPFLAQFQLSSEYIDLYP